MLSLSHVWLSVTPWTVAHQAPLFMGFSRQEYWSGLSFSPPGYLSNPGIKPRSPSLAGGIFTNCTLSSRLFSFKIRFERSIYVSMCRNQRTEMDWNGWIKLWWPLYLLLWAGIPQKKWSGHHGQQKSLKCSTWMQSQKLQNDLCSFPRQTIQYHSNPSLCLNQ